MKNVFKFLGIIAFAAVIGFSIAACDNGGDGGIPAALTGRWYTQAGDLAFEVTSAGLFSIAGQLFDITVSGNTVILKQGGTTVGSFDYVISNNTMTITNGMVVGQTVALLSPVVKIDSSPGNIPAALVGNWNTQAGDSAFEITSAGKLIIAGQSFDITVSGNTVILKQGGTTVGSFDYVVSNNTMTVINGMMVGQSVALLSPVVKSGGSSPGGSIPTALVGNWNTQAGDSAFEVTSAGRLLTAGQSFDITVSGNTVTLKSGGAPVGTFNYVVSNNTMTITNGTGIGQSIALLSPVVKSGGSNQPPIDINTVPVTGVTLTPATLNLAVGDTYTLTWTITPPAATNKAVSWSSTSASVIVLNGTLYATAAGAATVTVATADGGKTASCSVTVTAGTGNNGGSSGGTFTLTGIPAEYNGKYAYLSSSDTDTIMLYGVQNINFSKGIITFCQISNGSASLPMWKVTGANAVRYSGNDTASIVVVISNTASMSNILTVDAVLFTSVTFANGNATRSWSRGIQVTPDDPAIPGENNSCIVQFEANGGYGSPPAAIYAQYGGNIQLPGQGGLYYVGYAFLGWIGPDGQIYAPGDWYTVYADTTLYAYWGTP